MVLDLIGTWLGLGLGGFGTKVLGTGLDNSNVLCSLIELLESCVDELIVHVRCGLTISNGSIKLLGSTLS